MTDGKRQLKNSREMMNGLLKEHSLKNHREYYSYIWLLNRWNLLSYNSYIEFADHSMLISFQTFSFAWRLVDIIENSKFRDNDACSDLHEFVTSIKEKYGLK